MISVAIALGVLGLCADALPALEAAKRGDGNSGAPMAGVLIETIDQAPQLITLHRRTSWTGDSPVSSWKARWTIVGSSSKPREIDSKACPGLAAEAESLQRLQLASLVTPPTLDPPVFMVDAPLYTVWARSRQPGGGSMLGQLTTSSGPVAEWAIAMRQALESCFGRQ